MDREERRNYMDNIEESIAMIDDEAGFNAASFLLERYGASCPEDLADCDIQEFYNELYAIEADLRD